MTAPSQDAELIARGGEALYKSLRRGLAPLPDIRPSIKSVSGEARYYAAFRSGRWQKHVLTELGKFDTAYAALKAARKWIGDYIRDHP